MKKNVESLTNTLNREVHEAGHLKSNSSYHEKSLEELKQRHNELNLINLLLSQEIQELLKEDQLA